MNMKEKLKNRIWWILAEYDEDQDQIYDLYSFDSKKEAFEFVDRITDSNDKNFPAKMLLFKVKAKSIIEAEIQRKVVINESNL